MRKMKRGDKIKLHSTENSGTKIEIVKEPTLSQRNPEKASNAIGTQVKQQENMDFLRDQRNNTQQHLLPPCFASIMKRKGGVRERRTKHWSLRTVVGRRQSAVETEPKPFTLSNHRTPTPPRRICQGIASHRNKTARHHGANEHGVSSSGKNPKHVTLQNQHQSKHNPTAIDRTRKKSQKEPGKMSSFFAAQYQSQSKEEHLKIQTFYPYLKQFTPASPGIKRRVLLHLPRATVEWTGTGQPMSTRIYSR